jgi:hypothetical protein
LGGQALSGHRGDGREPCFWGHRLLQQFGSPPVHGKFRFQGCDPLAGGDQLGVVGGGDAGQQSRVNTFLPAPVVDGLITDLEIRRDGRDRATGPDEIEDSAAELRRIRLRHLVASSTILQREKSTKPTPPNPGHISESTEPGAVPGVERP